VATHIPGTRSLKVLQHAGRHLSFSRAAEELGLTPAAVSHQIREMEDQFGFALFTRTSRTMRLTEAGVLVLEAANDALQELERAVARGRRMTRRTTELRVTMDAVFASKWLVPRLDAFRKAVPDVELRFDITTNVRDFDNDDVDVGIRFGAGRYKGLVAERLFDNVIVPVCSPNLLRSELPLKEPRDLLRHTLAHIEWSGLGITWPTWSTWMAAAGIRDFDGSQVLQFADSAHAIQAAVEGNVVALADFAMVASDLSSGRLVRPFALGIRMPAEFAYFLVYPTASAGDARVARFRDWLLDEVKNAPPV